MLILFLNAWGGNVPGYLDWMEDVGSRADVICLSEVHNSFGTESLHEFTRPTNRIGPVQLKQFQLLSDMLKDSHQGHFAEAYRGLHDCESADKVPQGIAMFIRRDIRAYGVVSSLLNRPYDGIHTPKEESGSRVIQSVFITSGKPLLLGHLHGLWTPRGKIDTESRYTQNNNILRHLLSRTNEPFSPVGASRILLGGDFNYTSKLDAFRQIRNWSYWGGNGAQVLNEQLPDGFNTRTRLYDPDKPHKEADMVFAGSAINATLRIDYDVPSDHAALWVEVRD